MYSNLTELVGYVVAGPDLTELLGYVPADLDLTELLGYAAAGLVLVTFSFRSITALRSVAIVSNLLFLAYAASAHLLPVLILHALLLPLNTFRLAQAFSATERINDPASHRETASDVPSPWAGPRSFHTPIARLRIQARLRTRNPSARRPPRAMMYKATDEATHAEMDSSIAIQKRILIARLRRR